MSKGVDLVNTEVLNIIREQSKKALAARLGEGSQDNFQSMSWFVVELVVIPLAVRKFTIRWKKP